MMDGRAGIEITGSTNILVKNFEIIGPALSITGAEATENRDRRIGLDDEYACGGWNGAETA